MTALACACGPLSPAPTDTTGSASSTVDAPEPTSDDVAASGSTSGGSTSTSTTSGGPTTTTDSTGQETTTTGSTTGALDPDTTDADTSSGSTAGDTTGAAPASCGPHCESTRETCPPGAQVNASVTGDTPVGPFTATFAAQSLPHTFGPSIDMVLLPGFSEGELCEQPSQLRLTLPGSCWRSEPELEVPVELLEDQLVVANATAKLHDYDCTWWGFLCSACEGHIAFDLEVDGDGWSLAGHVDAGCCRSFYDNNTP